MTTIPTRSPRPDVQFSYKLKGHQEKWSTWTTANTKEFTKLSPGEYTFYIKAKPPEGITSESKSFSFIISPPWYLSKLALFIYGLLTILSIGSLILIPKRK